MVTKADVAQLIRNNIDAGLHPQIDGLLNSFEMLSTKLEKVTSLTYNAFTVASAGLATILGREFAKIATLSTSTLVLNLWTGASAAMLYIACQGLYMRSAPNPPTPWDQLNDTIISLLRANVTGSEIIRFLTEVNYSIARQAMVDVNRQLKARAFMAITPVLYSSLYSSQETGLHGAAIGASIGASAQFFSRALTPTASNTEAVIEARATGLRQRHAAGRGA